MIIKNGNVFCPDGNFRRRDVYIDENTNTITQPFAPGPDEVLVDAKGSYVLPGLVDVHTHGAVGGDFCDADPGSLEKIAAYEQSVGVTAFCPTSMTFPEDRLAKVFATAGTVPEDKAHAHVCGINVEGPFISPRKVGAQNPKYVIPPDLDMFRRLEEAATAPLKLITIAPEEEGAMAFIDAVKDDIHVSIGHSAAEYDVAVAAFATGADHITHLYNGGMGAFRHRGPGICGAASDACCGSVPVFRDVFVELIADGIHSDPSAIRCAFRLMGPDHMVLISDSMRATGMPDGESELGGQVVNKKGSLATLENGTIAGSVTNLMDCMKNAIRCGIPPEHAIAAATINPARSIGLGDTLGVIRPGARADLLLLDQDWELQRVL